VPGGLVMMPNGRAARGCERLRPVRRRRPTLRPPGTTCCFMIVSTRGRYVPRTAHDHEGNTRGAGTARLAWPAGSWCDRVDGWRVAGRGL